MSPPPFLDQKLPTPGSSFTAMPLGDFGPKPDGCIYGLHPGCHTFGNTRLRLFSIEFPITEDAVERSLLRRLAVQSALKDNLSPFVVTPVVGPRYFLPQSPK